jgi:hypothetical protein
MTMPRLSLYRPEKGKDYKFIDRTIWEMFQVGGTDVLVHKYLGPGDTAPGAATPSTPEYTGGTNPFQIQDLLFLENRDRKYEPDVYLLRGVYNISDIDFNLSQFGLFLQNDTVFITFHINDTVEKIGRKIIAGDVIELPHLKDEHALNDLTFALKRFYVIEEVSRAAEGFSVTWYPHLYRAKCKPLVDSQEFKQILDGLADRDSYQGVWDPAVDYKPGDIVSYPDLDGIKYTSVYDNINIPPRNLDGTLNDAWKPADSLRDIMSTYETEMRITQAVLDQAEADAPLSGYDTTSYYTLQVDQDGKPELVNVNQSDLLANQNTFATDVDGNFLFKSPFDALKKYLVGDEFTYNENWYKVLTASTNEVNAVPPSESYELLRPVVQNGSIDDDRIVLEPNASTVNQTAESSGYPGYLVGDGIPPNGAPFTSGISFPNGPIKGQFCLRTDYMPRRLFRFDGARWIKVEDDVRMTMSNNDARNTYKSGFVNNTNEKSNFNKKISDTFFVNQNPNFVYPAPVQSFTITDREGQVVTIEDYDNSYGVEAFVNEVPVKVVILPNTIKITFVIKAKIKVGDKIEWSLYKQQIDQRQALSKALRPKADL